MPGVDVPRFITPVTGSIFNPAGNALKVPPVAPVVVSVVVPVAQKVPPLTVAVGDELTVIVLVPPEPGVAPVIPPVIAPIVHTNVLLGKLAVKGRLVTPPLHIVAVLGVVNAGPGSTAIIIVYGRPGQELAVGIIIYSTVPVEVLLGFVRI